MQFLSTPSARRATRQRGPCRHHRSISIHALREEGDAPRVFKPRAVSISIHALREEGDVESRVCAGNGKNFYPRPPRGGRRYQGTLIKNTKKFLSTPSARRATPCIEALCCVASISIHALREEGDMLLQADSSRASNFYPRPPRGGRHVFDFGLIQTALFLSTPSARRATTTMWKNTSWPMISIHALREEGDDHNITGSIMTLISIHALREEGDSKNRDKISIFKQIIQHSARI